MWKTLAVLLVLGAAANGASAPPLCPKGEITLVLGPSDRSSDPEGEERALAALDELVSVGMARRQAADLVARLTGMSRNTLYRRSL